MGSFKKEAARKEREGKKAGGMGNVKTKGENFYRYELTASVSMLEAATYRYLCTQHG